MHDFVAALLGGAMIGLAAVLLMASHGKIMGVSGIASRLLPPVAADWLWRVAFIAGVLAAPVIYMAVAGTLPAVAMTVSPLLLISGGLLVGAGTVIGNGCTSCHGVCGLSRLSRRSIVSTGVFMLSAVITVFIFNTTVN